MGERTAQTSEAIPAWAPRHRQLWCEDCEWILSQRLIAHDAPSSLDSAAISYSREKVVLYFQSLQLGQMLPRRSHEGERADPRPTWNSGKSTRQVSVCRWRQRRGLHRMTLKMMLQRLYSVVERRRSRLRLLCAGRDGENVPRRGGACRTLASWTSDVRGLVMRMPGGRGDWSHGAFVLIASQGRAEK